MRITNIQNTTFNDGPGIRTTIFCKGCSLHCPWCANPECIISENDFPSKDYSQADIITKIMLQKKYIKNGGVTFSGGEALLQLNENINLLKKLKEEKINICLETSLFCSEKQLLDVIDYIDLFIIDIKILDKELCKKILGGDIEKYFSNLKIIQKKTKDFIFRMITINEITLTDINLFLLDKVLKEIKPLSFEFFNFHNLAKNKYKKLNLIYNDYLPAEEKKIHLLKKILTENNINFKELTI